MFGGTCAVPTFPLHPPSSFARRCAAASGRRAALSRTPCGCIPPTLSGRLPVQVRSTCAGNCTPLLASLPSFCQPGGFMHRAGKCLTAAMAAISIACTAHVSSPRAGTPHRELPPPVDTYGELPADATSVDARVTSCVHGVLYWDSPEGRIVLRRGNRIVQCGELPLR